jgi:hypothetical protein
LVLLSQENTTEEMQDLVTDEPFRETTDTNNSTTTMTTVDTYIQPISVDLGSISILTIWSLEEYDVVLPGKTTQRYKCKSSLFSCSSNFFKVVTAHLLQTESPVKLNFIFVNIRVMLESLPLQKRYRDLILGDRFLRYILMGEFSNFINAGGAVYIPLVENSDMYHLQRVNKIYRELLNVLYDVFIYERDNNEGIDRISNLCGFHIPECPGTHMLLLIKKSNVNYEEMEYEIYSKFKPRDFISENEFATACCGEGQYLFMQQSIVKKPSTKSAFAMVLFDVENLYFKIELTGSNKRGRQSQYNYNLFEFHQAVDIHSDKPLQSTWIFKFVFFYLLLLCFVI